MTARIDAAIAAGRVGARPALAPYVTAGDGGLDRTLAVLHALERAGAACVELGLPFSDPIADGPHLQAAAQRALDAGTTPAGVLDLRTPHTFGGTRFDRVRRVGNTAPWLAHFARKAEKAMRARHRDALAYRASAE